MDVADGDLPAVYRSPYPFARDGLKIFRVHKLHAFIFRARYDCCRKGMLTAAFQAGPQLQDCRFLESLGSDHTH